MSSRSHDAASRYWVTVLVGPCSETEAKHLCLAVAGLEECQSIGGVVGYEVAEDQEVKPDAKP